MSEVGSSRGTAAGKVIFFGEHAVVYGVPGIAAGIARGAEAHASQALDNVSSLTLGGRTALRDDDSDLARSFRSLLDHGEPLPALTVHAKAEIPPGGGLGCSAALGVSIARAALIASGKPASDDEVFERAMAWERVYHGNPSGIDTAAALHGGFLRFERGTTPTAVACHDDVWIAVGYSGSSASTKIMVEGIARLQTTDPTLHARFLSGVRALTTKAEHALATGDAQAFGALMGQNQQLLRDVHVSTNSIDEMCELALRAGALGVKLTGSGGGGSVIALGGFGDAARGCAEAITAVWQGRGFTAFVTTIRCSAERASAEKKELTE